ncbi:LOW QUALITY PROTEIN: uncharacterized protein LOC134949961 [Pseudophryne corroboree]|uniref:LOW QUALITY PROTEIN: uncharacterized protein LOC134949961 n=1 Tax=Pseudophryne corroboree TaxID=495146 RepID=UPI003081D969
MCHFCGAHNFLSERPSDGKFTSCCQKGKVKLPKPKNINDVDLQYSHFLCQLLSDIANPNRIHFRDNIRSYNSAVSFASMGATIVTLPGNGPYVFKVHGQTYHRTSHLQPINNQAPQFAQLYVIDSTQAANFREEHAANDDCRPEIVDQIDRFFRKHNRLAHSYQLISNIHKHHLLLAAQTGEQVPVVSMALRRDRHSDYRRYNTPTSNEVAMIFVNEDGEPPFQRDIRIYPKNPEDPNQPFINLNILSPNMDPMTYALFFPYGEPGWQPNWQCHSYSGAQLNQVRTYVGMLQYKAALTAIRDEFSPIMSAGKLTQQWLVDSYLQVEANRLNCIRHNQKRLRAEQYQGLADHLANIADYNNIPPGVPIILPSSFEGSPRHMRERCCDAMSIFSKWGAPDIFITFTANPTWTEIIDNLKPGEQTSDRPDLVARIFKIKLDALMDDLTKHCLFGQTKSFVYTIEFQKRGLPHAHILLALRAEDNFTTAERIDKFVSAEIPHVQTPILRQIITRCMLHGPCGTSTPRAPCMKDGKCTKQFPKDFNENTIIHRHAYPVYQRRSQQTVEVRGVLMSNQNVVPYNPYLALKYNAHINVEVCTSLYAIKYIYKYIFKGFDCANVVINPNGQPEQQYNEIQHFIDCRYVSPPEAIWQTIIFEHGHEEEALLAAQTGKTKLESWFDLNAHDPHAQQWLYTDIPHYYVYTHGLWQKRKRGGDKIVARMYTVSLKNEKRFYLRMLLLHVPGAISFQSLRTVNNVDYETFKAAAFARGLLASDDEWHHCLTDEAIYLMPKQLREMFSYICCFCQPTQPLQLWEDHLLNLTLDFMQHNSANIAQNKALHQINTILKQHGFSCTVLGLPIPQGQPPPEDLYNLTEESQEAQKRLAMLNPQQLHAFNTIIMAVDNSHFTNHQFYLDGPGGSGKTFLYTTLIAYIRGKGNTVLPFATTGIAATLLKGGCTVHSGFKLPVPLLHTSVSSLRLTSPEAQILRQATLIIISLIIIDEITMLPKHGLRCIDTLLRDIMNINTPFGNKVIVLGGDFRQTLPVVPRGTQTDILECCIKASHLWKHFAQLTLTTNMRTEGDEEHNTWLLHVGMGTLPPNPNFNDNTTIQVPQHMVTQDDLIETIFHNLHDMSEDDLAKRDILAPTNAHTLDMNRKIIDLMTGNATIYYSADSVDTEDPNDTLIFPLEFLHNQTPSGMPPHVLLLKKGVIIMLLRNLNPQKGLCNGTRLIVEHLAHHFIQCRILSQCNHGDVVFIPRIDLAPNDTTLPFILRRRQFPIIPAYAITINRSQGQTFDHVGIFRQTSVFSHGQLYVALSRSRNAHHVKVHITPTEQQGQLLGGDQQFTKNVVFKQIFHI